MYWYYRKEKIETYGQSKVLIVCEKGHGLRNFKILARSNNEIEVGFSIGPVRVSEYAIYHKDYTEFVKQAYYILDVMTGKIRRVQRINANTAFPKAFNKSVVSFCLRKNVAYTMFSSEKEYYVKPFDTITGSDSAGYNADWLNIADLPESIFELDFKEEIVQNVHVITFLK